MNRFLGEPPARPPDEAQGRAWKQELATVQSVLGGKDAGFLNYPLMTLPDGVQHLPREERETKDPDGGWIWGNHPDMKPETSAKLREMVKSKKASFAYSIAELPGYHGGHGDFKIELDVPPGYPIYTKPRRKSPMVKQVVDGKCSELAAARLIEQCTDFTYACETTAPVKKDAEGN